MKNNIFYFLKITKILNNRGYVKKTHVLMGIDQMKLW